MYKEIRYFSEIQIKYTLYSYHLSIACIISTASFLSKNWPYKAVKIGFTVVDHSILPPEAAIFGKRIKITN